MADDAQVSKTVDFISEQGKTLQQHAAEATHQFGVSVVVVGRGDAQVGELTVSGTPEQVQAFLDDYNGGAGEVSLHQQ